MLLYVDPVPLVAYLSVFMDTCLPSVGHMKNIAHRVSTYLFSCEDNLCTHINELLSTGVSVFHYNIVWKNVCSSSGLKYARIVVINEFHKVIWYNGFYY